MAHQWLTFVNKADPCQQIGHEGLAFGDPDVAGCGDLGALLFDGAQVFFVRQAEVAQRLPDRAAMHRNAMRGRNLGGKRGGSQVPRLADPTRQPPLQGRQLAMPAAVALGLW